MDWGTKKLTELLEKVKNMSIEEYDKLFNQVKEKRLIEHCGNCKFWKTLPHQEPGLSRNGKCRRFPPKLNSKVVSEEEWCGEYVFKMFKDPDTHCH